ncbi:MAG TPA: sensor histidine kinase N-terminal domain-containing protein [Albitalea sp.]|nr:sensor histidine kinase N-terminal domain-containing protein [Albitalea sp.]
MLLLAVNAFFSDRVAVATANTAFDRLLTASADAIADQITVQDGVLRVDLPYVALQLLESRLQERVFYRVVGPDGKTLTGYDDLPLPTRPPPPADAAVLYSAQYHGELTNLVALYRQIYGGTQTQRAVIVVAETGESRAALSRQIVVESLARQGLLIAAAGILLWLGLGRGLRPLARLRDSLMNRSSADLSPIDQTSVQREVQPLIEALNQHTARIEKLIASRQRFIADASHQMRTPLAEMRTQIEYSLRQQRPELAHGTLQDLQHGIDGLARMIAQMLLLARSDPDVLDERQVGLVNLTSLARDTALEFVPAARKKAIDLSFEEGRDDVFASGNEQLLHELIVNLIDNAILYTPANGMITVRVFEREAATLEVEDNGPGIPPEERDKVFERFYRGTASAPGSGLGLAIVRDICISHRAWVELDTPATGRGLCVRVRLPPVGQFPAE